MLRGEFHILLFVVIVYLRYTLGTVSLNFLIQEFSNLIWLVKLFNNVRNKFVGFTNIIITTL